MSIIAANDPPDYLNSFAMQVQFVLVFQETVILIWIFLIWLLLYKRPKYQT